MARQGNTIQINVTIPKELNERLRNEAEKEKRSLSNFIALLLDKGMERLPKFLLFKGFSALPVDDFT